MIRGVTSISGMCFGSDFPVSGSASGSAGDGWRLGGEQYKVTTFQCTLAFFYYHSLLQWNFRTWDTMGSTI